MLKIGLIGAGLMGQVHARAYANVSQAHLAAVADIRPDKAAEAAKPTAPSSLPPWTTCWPAPM